MEARTLTPKGLIIRVSPPNHNLISRSWPVSSGILWLFTNRLGFWRCWKLALLDRFLCLTRALLDRLLCLANVGWDLLSSTSHEILSLGSIVSSKVLDALETLAGTFASNVFDLIGLGRDDVASMFQLSVDDIFVLDVDQRSQVDDACAQESESPDRNDLDQVVGEEGREERLK